MVLSEEEKKRRRREYNKKYHIKYIKTEKGKEKKKANYLKHKEKNKNNEERKKKQRENHKEWCKTPAGLKSAKKNHWKKNGLNMKYFEIIYLLYLGTTDCEFCGCILTKDRYNTPTTKCLDHSHITGKFRNILCHSCNVKRREDNF